MKTFNISNRRRVKPSIVLAVGFLVSVLGWLPGGSLAAGERVDAFDTISSAWIENGRPSRCSEQKLVPGVVSPSGQGTTAADSPSPPTCEPGLDPTIETRLAERGLAALETIVVTLSDSLTVPRFPRPATQQPWWSPANWLARCEARRLARRLEADRRPRYEEFESLLKAACPEARVIRRFWLIQALAIELPLGCIEKVRKLQGVCYLEAALTDYPPPGSCDAPSQLPDCDFFNCVSIGRALIASDGLSSRRFPRSWIGILDTGVSMGHSLLRSPRRIRRSFDCTTTTGICVRDSKPIDHCDHGTQTATVLSANHCMGNFYRGVTANQLDSFKVFVKGSPCKLVTPAAVAGFEAALLALNEVIVAQIQGEASSANCLSTAADRAFDAGAVVIAANGNSGPDLETVNSPAAAHKALGIGAFNVETLKQFNRQSCGSTDDGRTKPDVQAPTDTRTGDSTVPHGISMFKQTSGATPYAAGAAALLRGWLRSCHRGRDPGQVYALMILAGQNPHPFDNVSGAGKLRLPSAGRLFWGKVALRGGERVEIPVKVPATTIGPLDASLWWPEEVLQVHSTVHLHLLDPGGTSVAWSTDGTSVFQRARKPGPLSPGAWKLLIERVDSGRKAQTVYWGALTPPPAVVQGFSGSK